MGRLLEAARLAVLFVVPISGEEEVRDDGKKGGPDAEAD
jgi:hypothetical protein